MITKAAAAVLPANTGSTVVSLTAPYWLNTCLALSLVLSIGRPVLSRNHSKQAYKAANADAPLPHQLGTSLLTVRPSITNKVSLGGGEAMAIDAALLLLCKISTRAM